MQLPQDCEALAEQVRLPTFADDDDFRVIAVRHRIGLIQANQNLEATRDCQRLVREQFAGEQR